MLDVGAVGGEPAPGPGLSLARILLSFPLVKPHQEGNTSCSLGSNTAQGL